MKQNLKQNLLIFAILIVTGCASSKLQPSIDAQSTPEDITQESLPDLSLDLSPAPDQEPAQHIMAGAAAVDITPSQTLGVPLAGFGGDPRRVFDTANIALHISFVLTGICIDPTPGTVASLFSPSEGKHDSIMARALVLDNGTVKAAIIKVDTVAVSRKLRIDVENFAATLGIKKEHLLIAATHTHSGPGAISEQRVWQMIAVDCFNDTLYASFLSGITSALTQANNALQIASIGIGTTSESRVSKNRMVSQGAVDPELGLIKIVDANGNPIAAIMNFAVHGTCMGKDNMLFSADIMGYAERELEKKLNGGIALFLNGAEGDVGPTKSDFEGAEELGTILAETSNQLWVSLTTKNWIEIRGHIADVQMPTPTLNGCPGLLGESSNICELVPGLIALPIAAWMQSNLFFAAMRLDDVVLAAVPGEALTEIGLKIKSDGASKGFRHTFVIGLANDYGAYFTTKDQYHTDHYEAQSTIYGEDTGTIVHQNVVAEIEEVL